MERSTQKFLILTLLLILVMSATSALAGESTQDLVTVVTGESRILAANEVTRVAIADESIADIIVVSPFEIIINGLKPGVTTLHVWEQGGRMEYLVKVYMDNSTLAAEIAEAIGDSQIRVRVLRQTIFLEGQVESDFSRTRAERIAQAYEEKVVNLLQLPLTPASPVANLEPEPEPEPVQDVPLGPDLQEVAESIGSYLGQEGFAAKIYGNGILLEGTVKSDAQKQRIEAIADFFSKQAGCDITVVAEQVETRGPKVALQVKVVELSTEIMDSIGLTWGSLYDGGVVPYELMFSQISLDGPIDRISPIAAKLNLMIQDGDARVLAAPSLVTNSSQQADFLAGGEIPVPVPQDGKLAILWKEYGVKLSMLPVVYDDVVNLEVAPEVSTLDMTNAIKLDGWVIPALKTRRTKTEIDLKTGETLVIGGLISSEQAKMVQKLPILGDIPIIGQLFRSTEFKDGQTQLLIMVTPKIFSDEDKPTLEYFLQEGLEIDASGQLSEFANPLAPRDPEGEGGEILDSTQD